MMWIPRRLWSLVVLLVLGASSVGLSAGEDTLRAVLVPSTLGHVDRAHGVATFRSVDMAQSISVVVRAAVPDGTGWWVTCNSQRSPGEPFALGWLIFTGGRAELVTAAPVPDPLSATVMDEDYMTVLQGTFE